jgi:hypothetical protein
MCFEDNLVELLEVLRSERSARARPAAEEWSGLVVHGRSS